MIIFLHLFIQLPYSHLIDPSRPAAVVAAKAAAAAATSAMEQTRLEEEKLRVQAKDKKDQSNKMMCNLFFILFANITLSGANASPEVKIHLKSFLCRKLQKEGKLE